MSVYLADIQHDADAAERIEAFADERDAAQAAAQFASNPNVQLVAAYCRRQLEHGLQPGTFAYQRAEIVTLCQTAIAHAITEAETGIDRSVQRLASLSPHDFSYQEQRRRYNDALTRRYQTVTRDYSRLLSICDAVLTAAAQAA